MKLTFLGTGAPEGNPSPFCDCVNCRYVRKKKGKNLRIQASLLVNNDLLLDFGPDVSRGFNKLGLSMSQLKYVLVTHCHFDHFYSANLFYRKIGPRTTKLGGLLILGPERMCTQSADWLDKSKEQLVTFKTIEPFKKYSIGPYVVSTFAITQQDAFAGKGMGYVIANKATTVFYGVDSYIFPDQSLKMMGSYIFDVVILDETFGYKEPPAKDHHNIPLFFQTIDKLKKLGAITLKTRIFTQHMSHHNPPHDKLVSIMTKKHVIVPYDGLRIYVS